MANIITYQLSIVPLRGWNIPPHHHDLGLIGSIGNDMVAMKLVVNQAFDNMGLMSTRQMGSILNSYMRNTPEG
jgi:hypothetical protein